MTVILICGGRSFGIEDIEKRYLNETMKTLFEKREPDLIIQGTAKGVDSFAEDYARSKQVNYYGVPAKWDLHGKKAGMLRNQEMLDLVNVDLVVAYPGGIGTKGMINLSNKAGIKVVDLEKHYNNWKSYYD